MTVKEHETSIRHQRAIAGLRFCQKQLQHARQHHDVARGETAKVWARYVCDALDELWDAQEKKI